MWNTQETTGTQRLVPQGRSCKTLGLFIHQYGGGFDSEPVTAAKRFKTSIDKISSYMFEEDTFYLYKSKIVYVEEVSKIKSSVKIRYVSLNKKNESVDILNDEIDYHKFVNGILVIDNI